MLSKTNSSFLSLSLRRSWKWLLFILIVSVFNPSPFRGNGGGFLYAQIPRTISYQGLLTDESGNPKPDDNYNFTFHLYEVEFGGTEIWSETKTLTTSKGLFSTSLGDLTAFGANVTFDKPYWLGIIVESGPELTPRVPLTSSGYSLTSGTTLNVVDGVVVKSINGLTDDITLVGAGGTTINSNGNTITISSSGSGGNGIQGVQNTNNTLDIINPNGPTATINVKVPLTLSSSSGNSTFNSFNTGSGIGIWGESSTGAGVIGKSSSWVGTYGETSTWFGLWGKATGTNGKGVLGESATSFGVWGISPNSVGVVGESDNWVGVYGETEAGNGVWGKSISGSGVFGESTNWSGVYGTTKGYRKYSVIGKNTYSSSNANTFGGLGYYGDDFEGFDYTIGVYGISESIQIAVAGHNTTYESFGALGFGGAGVYGKNQTGLDYAGRFQGDVGVYGNLEVYGTKSFKIDHPLDPANKYLIHSCVESSDRMNIYNGNITTDANGSATVVLPGYFETLNIDYRYQLTVIGQFAQAIIESEIQNNQFTIRTDKPDVKVSWQVSGVRNDEYAKQHPFVVEQEKDASEKGKYLMPELFGQPEEIGINYVKIPEIKEQNNQNIPQTDLPKMELPERPNLDEVKNGRQN